jgi:hypothetical protein
LIKADLHADTYYVDCENGKDSNSGLTEMDPWRSSLRVAEFNFKNGDSVLFKRGCRWENASLKVKHSLELGAYGDSEGAPELMGAGRLRSWLKRPESDIVSAQAAIEEGVPSMKDVLVVYDARHNRFYDKVQGIDALKLAGFFHYDLPKKTVYVLPLPETNPREEIYVASRPHIIEFQQVNLERVVVKGLSLSFANEYAIGFWYQSSTTTNGKLVVEDCTFFGNGYQAIHIAGSNTFEDVEIIGNTITACGHEGVYIGYIKGQEQGQVIRKMLRVAGNTIGGNNFGWRSIGVGSAANGDGLDIKRGIAAAVIENNTIRGLKGAHAILVQSSNVIIQGNEISAIELPGGSAEDSITAINLDAYDNKGTAIVRNNRINVNHANGIVIRGDADLKPRSLIYSNDIRVQSPFFPFAFTSQNVTNTEIMRNRTTGGRAALLVLRPCCPPADVKIYNNEFRSVVQPVVSFQASLPSVHFHANTFCLKKTGKVASFAQGETLQFPNKTLSTDNTITSCN